MQIQGLIHMKCLSLCSASSYNISAGLLSGMQQLTHLDVQSPEANAAPGQPSSFDPGAWHAQLHSVSLSHFTIAGGSAGTAQLLSAWSHMQQLTCLDFRHSLPRDETGPPAAAYSALTASSKLSHLGVSWCTLPDSVWQHVFPNDRRLPDLQSLVFAEVKQQQPLIDPPATPAAAPVPDGDRIVCCCPGLRQFHVPGLFHTQALLAPLTGLTALDLLNLNPASNSTSDGRELVLQLTGLKALHMVQRGEDGALLLQLGQLRQLTQLDFIHIVLAPPAPSGLERVTISDRVNYKEVSCVLGGHFPIPG